MNIAEAVRLIRLYKDFKQSELAGKMGVAKSSLCEVESGRKVPNIRFLTQFSEQVHIPISSICFFAENLDDPLLGMDKARTKFSGIDRKVVTYLALLNDRQKT